MLTGCLPQTADARDFPFVGSSPHLLGAARVPVGTPAAFDFRPFDVQRTQLTNSCVGHSVAGAAALTAALADKPITFPSPLFAYAGGRINSKNDKTAPLVDTGTMFRDALRWAHTNGLIAEERWKEYEDTVNVLPPLDCYEAGESAILDAYYAITPGTSAPGDIRTALAAGHCPIFSFDVDDAYGNTGAAVYREPGGKVLGGHAQVVVGYRPDVDAFIIRNTWGSTWGDGGYGYIASSFMGTGLDGIWVITVAPKEPK